MPVTGVKEVKANMKSVFKDIADKKAPQFIYNVVNIGVAHSKELTPIEYSNLINSIVTNVDVEQTGVVGTVEYMADYAAALEFGTWKPVAAVNKEGPADNMDAKPHFLREGFESSESKAAIKQVQDIFKL